MVFTFYEVSNNRFDVFRKFFNQRSALESLKNYDLALQVFLVPYLRFLKLSINGSKLAKSLKITFVFHFLQLF